MQTATQETIAVPVPPTALIERTFEYRDVDSLEISPTNVRYAKKAPDVSDILPSVKTKGVLQPVLVRIEGERIGIVAGRRRWYAARAAVEKTGIRQRIPTLLLEDGEDAEAVEASLLENFARQDMDQVAEFVAFNRLAKDGKSIEEIAATFNVRPITVRQRLAIATLHPRIRTLYQQEEIGNQEIQALCMASKKQQRDWLALYKTNQHPRAWQLKDWLFGGSISPTVAIFDVEATKLSVVADLFGDSETFADVSAFWEHQNAAIEAETSALTDAGWVGVVQLDRSEHFAHWEYQKTKKADGGKVFVEVKNDGSVKFHKGYLSKQEARRAHAKNGKGGTSANEKPVRAEITAATQNYLEYHRHAAVRAELLTRPGVALRLTVATMIAGTALWRAEADASRYANETVAESITGSSAHVTFVTARDTAKTLIGDEQGEGLVHYCRWDGPDATAVFLKLLPLTDEQVLEVLAVIAGETLLAGDELVELLGNHLEVDMAKHWQPEPALLELLRDKTVLLAILTEVAGKKVAKDHEKATGKVMKAEIQTALNGDSNWLPRYLAFPFSTYVRENGVGIASAWKNVRKLLRKK